MLEQNIHCAFSDFDYFTCPNGHCVSLSYNKTSICLPIIIGSKLIHTPILNPKTSEIETWFLLQILLLGTVGLWALLRQFLEGGAKREHCFHFVLHFLEPRNVSVTISETHTITKISAKMVLKISVLSFRLMSYTTMMTD